MSRDLGVGDVYMYAGWGKGGVGDPLCMQLGLSDYTVR